MLTSSSFEPRIENAPCPPFFVENIYDIFISSAANNNLTANVTTEVWNKCSLQYPYPTTTTAKPTTTSTTTPTTITTTEKVTTSTTKQTTTSTTEQSTTSATKPTTTSTTRQTTTTKPTTTSTPKQTTISTTKLTTTSTPKQTTISTTKPTTTSTPKQTTTSTTEQSTTSTTKPTTTSTTEQATTTKPTTASTPKQTTISTTKLTTTSTTKQTTISTTKPTKTFTTKPMTKSTTEQTTTFTTKQTSTLSTETARSTTEQTTVLTTELIRSTQTATECDNYCLALTTSFSVCVFLGLFAMVCFCANRRKRRHKLKHSLLNKRNWKGTNDKYIQKFPKISRQADLTMPPLAFVNPTFVSHNGYKPDPNNVNTPGYHYHNAYSPRNQRENDPLPNANDSHYEVIVNPRRLWSPEEEWKTPLPKMNGFVHSHRTPITKRARHTSIGSHIPKVIPDYEEIYPFGISSYDTSSKRNGLPKINIKPSENNCDMNSDTRPQLPRIPFSEQENTSIEEDYSSIESFVFQKAPLEEIPDINKRDDSHVVQGLPRIPIDVMENRWDSNLKPARPGLPRTGLEETQSGGSSLYNYNQKHGLPRTPFEEPQKRDGKHAFTKQHGLPRLPLDKISDSVVESREFRSDTFSLYQGNRDQKVLSVYNSVIDADGGSRESNISFPSNKTPFYVTKL
ncbi:uncharacterized protein LOC123539922 [Mercenaria mercenaria]|uniref:uncharacterized protein LOC123539922 n=1 Tax=Mercenaria mercenaria TaxID=6596 RepID=UPI00234F2612|nr:uncharacterized protein LOC123539922 [Mercenaria mercenaria]